MLMLNIPVIIFLFSLSWVVGMCIYSVYSDCDPLKYGYTKSADALLPFYIQDKYSFIPGLIGIFLSTLFNSALILNVSNLNSLATVTWEDFLSHLPQFKGMPDKKQLQIIKFIGSVYGLMIMGVGFLVQLLSGVIESAQLMTSATSGPLLGVFLLAILVPFANWKGAAVGIIMSHLIILSVTFGHLQLDKTVHFLETSIDGCTNDTFSSDIQQPAMSMLVSLSHNNPIIVDHWMENATKSALMETAQSTSTPLTNLLNEIFSISYMYYSFIGTCITVIIGSIVSLLTMSKDDAYESRYIHPFVFKLAKVFPGHCYLFSDEHQLTDSLKKNSPKDKSHVIVEHDNYAFDIKTEESKDSSLNSANITHVVPDVHSQVPESEKYRKLEDV